jgi:hypothetical protein
VPRGFGVAEEQADWKKKYRTLALETERNEKSSMEAEQQLRQLLGYMAVKKKLKITRN